MQLLVTFSDAFSGEWRRKLSKHGMNLLVEKLSSLKTQKYRKYTAPLGHYYQNCRVGTARVVPFPT
jgi:hypothetical protein